MFGDAGLAFDPIGLAAEKNSVTASPRSRDHNVKHGRVAMLGRAAVVASGEEIANTMALMSLQQEVATSKKPPARHQSKSAKLTPARGESSSKGHAEVRTSVGSKGRSSGGSEYSFKTHLSFDEAKYKAEKRRQIYKNRTGGVNAILSAKKAAPYEQPHEWDYEVQWMAPEPEVGVPCRHHARAKRPMPHARNNKVHLFPKDDGDPESLPDDVGRCPGRAEASDLPVAGKEDNEEGFHRPETRAHARDCSTHKRGGGVGNAIHGTPSTKEPSMEMYDGAAGKLCSVIGAQMTGMPSLFDEEYDSFDVGACHGPSVLVRSESYSTAASERSGGSLSRSSSVPSTRGSSNASSGRSSRPASARGTRSSDDSRTDVGSSDSYASTRLSDASSSCVSRAKSANSKSSRATSKGSQNSRATSKGSQMASLYRENQRLKHDNSLLRKAASKASSPRTSHASSVVAQRGKESGAASHGFHAWVAAGQVKLRQLPKDRYYNQPIMGTVRYGKKPETLLYTAHEVRPAGVDAHTYNTRQGLASLAD